MIRIRNNVTCSARHRSCNLRPGKNEYGAGDLMFVDACARAGDTYLSLSENFI